MTQQHDDGGPAFPPVHNAAFRGMSLRDWFAGQTLAGLMGNHETWAFDEAKLAYLAYEAADAMLAARSEAKP